MMEKMAKAVPLDSMPECGVVKIELAGFRPRMEGNTLVVEFPVRTGPIFHEEYLNHLKKMGLSERKIDQMLDDVAEGLYKEEVAALVITRIRS